MATVYVDKRMITGLTSSLTDDATPLSSTITSGTTLLPPIKVPQIDTSEIEDLNSHWMCVLK